MSKYLSPLGLVFAAAAAVAVPYVVTNDYYLNVAILILWFAFLSTAWNLVGGYAGQLSLGHGSLTLIGAYVSSLLFLRFGLSPWIGMLIAGVIAAGVALLIGIPTFRLRGPYYALATVAVAEMLVGIVLNTEKIGAWPIGGARGILIPLKPESLWILQFSEKWQYYYVMLGLLIVLLATVWLIVRSRIGRYLMAVRDDHDAAQALGINAAGYKLLALAVSGFFSALGGVFFAQYYLYIEPSRIGGLDLSTEIALIAILGGRGSIFGPLVGAIILVPLGELTRAFFGSSLIGMHLLIYGVVLITVIMLEPRGIIALAGRLVGWFRRPAKADGKAVVS
jgi:branched-chain amino acid transport system permease protein